MVALSGATARDVPELRADMLAWLTEDGPSGYLRQHLTHLRKAGFPADPARERAVRDVTVTRVRAAELFFVSAPMTELARAAGTSLPAYRLHAEDLPAPIGLAVYSGSLGGIGDGQARLVLWGPGEGGLTVSIWADSAQFWGDLAADAGWDQAEVHRRFGPVAFLHAAVFPWRETPRGWGTVSLTSPDQEVRPSDLENAERAVMATWLLMGQTLTRSEQVHPPRSARRRVARTGADPLMPVRYTDLRRIRAVDGDQPQPAPEGSRFEHQWIVRGHWRQQWFPSRRDHRPIWISPHLKGPEGAPLLGGERVYLLRR